MYNNFANDDDDNHHHSNPWAEATGGNVSTWRVRMEPNDWRMESPRGDDENGDAGGHDSTTAVVVNCHARLIAMGCLADVLWSILSAVMGYWEAPPLSSSSSSQMSAPPSGHPSDCPRFVSVILWVLSSLLLFQTLCTVLGGPVLSSIGSGTCLCGCGCRRRQPRPPDRGYLPLLKQSRRRKLLLMAALISAIMAVAGISLILPVLLWGYRSHHSQHHHHHDNTNTTNTTMEDAMFVTEDSQDNHPQHATTCWTLHVLRQSIAHIPLLVACGLKLLQSLLLLGWAYGGSEYYYYHHHHYNNNNSMDGGDYDDWDEDNHVNSLWRHDFDGSGQTRPWWWSSHSTSPITTRTTNTTTGAHLQQRLLLREPGMEQPPSHHHGTPEWMQPTLPMGQSSTRPVLKKLSWTRWFWNPSRWNKQSQFDPSTMMTMTSSSSTQQSGRWQHHNQLHYFTANHPDDDVVAAPGGNGWWGTATRAASPPPLSLLQQEWAERDREDPCWWSHDGENDNNVHNGHDPFTLPTATVPPETTRRSALNTTPTYKDHHSVVSQQSRHRYSQSLPQQQMRHPSSVTGELPPSWIFTTSSTTLDQDTISRTSMDRL